MQPHIHHLKLTLNRLIPGSILPSSRWPQCLLNVGNVGLEWGQLEAKPRRCEGIKGIAVGWLLMEFKQHPLFWYVL